MTPKGAILMLLLALTLGRSECSTRYFVKMRTNASDLFKTKSESLRVLQDPIAVTRSPFYNQVKSDTRDEDERMIRDTLKTQFDRRNSFLETSTFNPDVLNKFLEEYANKIKSTTEKDFKFHPFKVAKPTTDPLMLEVDDDTTTGITTISDQEIALPLEAENSTLNDGLSEILNDTLKRNKYYGSNAHDDRNGWVTLDAIPWSKSKISKWQANPSTQRPWPEMKPWEKPGMAKPWSSDYPIRPTNYENNKPWYDKPKPHWAESANEKPWSKPSQSSRPSYYPDKYDDGPTDNQKWPPERPSWDKYSDHDNRPSDIIITDDRPSNFPNAWNRPQMFSKPGYQFADRYTDRNDAGDDHMNDWHDFPSRYDQNDRPRPTGLNSRPHFSQYQYVSDHPQSHPANGDGQWVLLSTNRGYSKSRQRSIKMDGINPASSALARLLNFTRTKTTKKENENDPPVAMMTSKRQVRLTVLPSINGTNTTTSHGGLLEVEKTFKSVDQSRKEYEMDRMTTVAPILRKRPIRNTMINGQPSSSAVLAAVGAGMLPATMAMMIPMMLGRRKRDLTLLEKPLTRYNDHSTDPLELANNYQRTRFLRL